MKDHFKRLTSLCLVPESHGEVSDTSKVVCSGQRAQRVVGEGIRVQQRLTCDASHLAQDKQSWHRKKIEGLSLIYLILSLSCFVHLDLTPFVVKNFSLSHIRIVQLSSLHKMLTNQSRQQISLKKRKLSWTWIWRVTASMLSSLLPPSSSSSPSTSPPLGIPSMSTSGVEKKLHCFSNHCVFHPSEMCQVPPRILPATAPESGSPLGQYFPT